MSKYLLIVIFILGLSISVSAQNVDEVERSGAFEYNGEDKLRSQLNFHDKHYAGFAVKSIIINNELAAIAYMLSYEYSYLLMPRNEKFNLSASAMPRVAFFPILGINVPLSVDLNIGNEAGTAFEGIGATFGAGYDTFFFFGGFVDQPSFTENSPFVRMRLSVNNFYGGIQINTNNGGYFRHSISGGVKLDL